MRARASSVEVSPFRRLQVFIIIKIKQEKKTTHFVYSPPPSNVISLEGLCT